MVRVISLCQAGVLKFTINMDEVCHHLHSLSFVDTSGKYIIICIFEHKTFIILYLTNKIITLWGKFSERRNTFHVLVSTSKTRQSQRELEHWGFNPLHCGIEGWAEKSTQCQFLKKQRFKKSKTRAVMTWEKKKQKLLLVKLHDELRLHSCSELCVAVNSAGWWQCLKSS